MIVSYKHDLDKLEAQLKEDKNISLKLWEDNIDYLRENINGTQAYTREILNGLKKEEARCNIIMGNMMRLYADQNRGGK